MNMKNQEQVPMTVTKRCQQPSETDNVPDLTVATTTDRQLAKQGARASWSNRIVYLLSIIGFVVDLGKSVFVIVYQYHFELFFLRKRLALSNNMLSQWGWGFSHTLFYLLISCWSSL